MMYLAACVTKHMLVCRPAPPAHDCYAGGTHTVGGSVASFAWLLHACGAAGNGSHLYTGSPVVGRDPPPLPLFGNQLRVKRIAYGTREVTPRPSMARMSTLYLQHEHADDV
jgi:hypothetical protein